MTGILYLIPNTLGEESGAHTLTGIIPQQVQSISASLDYFIAENAKSTRAYLKLLATHQPLAKPLQSIQISALNINTPASELPALLEPLLQGRDAGLISEAGVPAVADPGANLVRLAHQHQIRVRPLVGPSSLLLGLMASGLNGQSFAFHGYLPTDAAQRQKRLKDLEQRSHQEQQTQLFIETPYRNAALLEAICQSCQADTLVCVATDLSLSTEAVQTQSVAQWKKQIAVQGVPDFHKKPTVFLFLTS
jgi:16S rRNA (cytidine1402-2'-O)-methyltransferase